MKRFLPLLFLFLIGCAHTHHSIMTSENKDGEFYSFFRSLPWVTVTLPGEKEKWTYLGMRDQFSLFQNSDGYQVEFGLSPAESFPGTAETSFENNKELLYAVMKWDGEFHTAQQDNWAEKYTVIEENIQNDDGDYLIWELSGGNQFQIMMTGLLNKKNLVLLTDTRKSEKEKIIQSFKWIFERVDDGN